MDVAVLLAGSARRPGLDAPAREPDAGAHAEPLGPHDRAAIACARQLEAEREATVHALALGEPDRDPLAAAAASTGDRLHRLVGPELAAGDPWARAHAFAAAVEAIGDVDLVLAGSGPGNRDAGQTAVQTGLLLDLPVVTRCTRLNARPQAGKLGARRDLGDAVEHCEAGLPALAVPTPDFEARVTRARQRLRLADLDRERANRDAAEGVREWTLDELPLDQVQVGARGSPTLTLEATQRPARGEREGRRVGSDENALAELARELVARGEA